MDDARAAGIAACAALEAVLIKYKDPVDALLVGMVKGWRGRPRDIQAASECLALIDEALAASRSGALAPETVQALSHTAYHRVWDAWIHWTFRLEHRAEVLTRYIVARA